MKEELVSIVVPTYHIPEKFLNKCLDSILNQSYKNLEILVMMNEKDKETIDLVKKFDKDKRLKIVYKNTSLANARNEGEKISTGKYLMFVDGDDWIEKEMVETMIKDVGNSDILIQTYLRDYEGKLVKENYLKKFEDNKEYKTKEELKYMTAEVLDFTGFISSANAKLYNLAFLKDNNIYHLEEIQQGCEGIVYNLLAFKEAKNIKFTNQCFYHYMYNENSISSKSTDINQEVLIKGFTKMKEIVEEMDDNKEILDMFYVRTLYLIITSAISGYFNYDNEDDFKTKKQKMKKFLDEDIIKTALKKGDRSKLNFQRRCILKLIDLRMFRMLELCGYIRRKQKEKGNVHNNQ